MKNECYTKRNIVKDFTKGISTKANAFLSVRLTYINYYLYPLIFMQITQHKDVKNINGNENNNNDENDNNNNDNVKRYYYNLNNENVNDKRR